MAGGIEAQSLASLSDHASNPPDRPNGAPRPHPGPLILYIVKVPGNQDVFLTPLKPRDKVVSAEDVNSCLYYLHVNQPSDEYLLEAARKQSDGHIQLLEGETSREKTIESSSAPSRPFQPLDGNLSGGTEKFGSSNNHHSTCQPAFPPRPLRGVGVAGLEHPRTSCYNCAKPPNQNQDGSQQEVLPPYLWPHSPPRQRAQQERTLHQTQQRHQNRQQQQQAQSHSRQSNPLPPSPPPPPVPERSPRRESAVLTNQPGKNFDRSTQPSLSQNVQIGRENVPVAAKSSRSMIKRKPIAEDNQLHTWPSAAAAAAAAPPSPPIHTCISANSNLQAARPPQGTVKSNGNYAPFRKQTQTLTLVRRVPFSTDQWNVATITDPGLEPMPFVPSSISLSSSTLSLSSDNHKASPKPRHTPLIIDILNPAYAKFEQRGQRKLEDNQNKVPTSNQDVFFRSQLSPDLSFLPSATGFTASSSDKGASIFGDHTLLRKSRNVSRSSVVVSALARPEEEQRYQRLKFAELPIASKGSGKTCYSFLSPWAGRCEILESLTGNSLKCRHASPALSHLAGPKGPVTVQVSELKFDLPTTSPSADSFKPARRPMSVYSNNGSQDLHNPARNNCIVSLDKGIDLTLGKERAGGGAGGKRAKLGKLIIEGEGLDMLDLLVAANLGLWWRVFSKQFN